MPNLKLSAALRANLKARVAILPLAAMLCTTQAFAQPAPQNPPAPAKTDQDTTATPDKDKEIVVTGTLIRGSAPTGTNPITVGEQQIESVGAARSSEVLAALPQIANNFFNGIPQTETINATAARGFNQTTNRPSLRPNPFGSTDSGNSTLILFDGARQAGIGVNGSSANPDSVPPALLARVEANPDGGSATYGSDAIGGVINFITKSRFKGLLVGGAVGVADEYTSWEANAAAGTEWENGGAYIGYSFTKNDILLNGQRDFFQPLDFATGLRRGLSCDTANIVIPAGGGIPIHYYAAPGGNPSATSFTVVAPLTGTPNVCSNELLATMASANEQHNVMARLSQNVTDDIELGLRLRFNDQKQSGLTAPATFSALINNTNPFFKPIPAAAGADSTRTSYTIQGSFEPALGASERVLTNSSQGWGALASLAWDIGKWRFNAIANYDHTKSAYSNPATNATVLTNGFNGNAGTTCSLQHTAATCFNPFNIAASDPALLASLANFFNIGQGRDTIVNFRGVFEGPLFQGPGGPVRLAVGVEYLRDKFAKGLYFGTTPSDLVMASVVQTNKSLFGEISVPVFSKDNEMPLFRDLRLSAAGRLDKYSGLDSVFNPKLGGSWKPFDFLTFRGNWSRTFRAPTTVDLLGTSVANTTIASFPACVFNCFAIDPSRTPPGNTDVFLGIQGTNPNITPQRGENWSYGADFEYHQFRASITYYRINYMDLLANPFNGTPVFPNLAFLVTLCPGSPGAYGCTAPQVANFASQAGIGNISAVPLNSIYGLYDTRTTNLGNSRVGGWDYSFQFNQPFSWGSVFLAVAGSINTLNETQALPGQPFVSNIPKGGSSNTGAFNLGRSLHRITVRTGVNYGAFRAQATLNRNEGYDVTRSATLLQDRVKSFNVVNLFFAYAFENESGPFKDLELTLNVNNVFDTDPPVELRTNSGNGFTNGQTLGRLIKFGIQKRF